MHSIQTLFGQIGSVLRKASQLLSSLNFGSIILCYARSRRYKSLVQVIGGWSKRKKSYGPEYGFTITQTSLRINFKYAVANTCFYGSLLPDLLNVKGRTYHSTLRRCTVYCYNYKVDDASA